MSTEALQENLSGSPVAWRERVVAWADRFEGWLAGCSDYLNPILVKETRQALKSRQFVLWFLLLLAACWIVTIGGVALIGPSIYYAASGGVFYYAYFVVLAFPLAVVVPFSTYRSLAAEQEENTRDLLMASALSPRQIINGKLGSAVLQMLVYFSALSPCLAFTYLLRGVDLVTVVLLPVYAFLTSLMLSMLGLVAASITRRKYGQVVVSIGLISILLGSFSWGLAAAAVLVHEGFRYFRDADFWLVNMLAMTFYLTTFLLLYFIAAGLNTFTAANRSTPIRMVLFIKQACAMGWLAYGWIESDYDYEPLLYAGVLFGMGWFSVASLMTGESPVLSNRVRRTLPESAFGRMMASWFNPGPDAGYLFAVATWMSVLICLVVAIAFTTNSTQRDQAFLFLAAATCYAVIFLGLGRIIVTLLRRIAEVTMLGCLLINFLLVLGCSAGPPLVAVWTGAARSSGFDSYYLFSPILTLGSLVGGRVNDEDLLLLAITLPGFAICTLLVSLVQAGRELRQSRTPIPMRVIEDELELNPLPTPAVKNPWGDK